MNRVAASSLEPKGVVEVELGRQGSSRLQETPHRIRKGVELLTDQDRESFLGGRYFRAYQKFGAHLAAANGVKGTFFAVWTPQAIRIQGI